MCAAFVSFSIAEAVGLWVNGFLIFKFSDVTQRQGYCKWQQSRCTSCAFRRTHSAAPLGFHARPAAKSCFLLRARCSSGTSRSRQTFTQEPLVPLIVVLCAGNFTGVTHSHVVYCWWSFSEPKCFQWFQLHWPVPCVSVWAWGPVDPRFFSQISWSSGNPNSARLVDLF